MLKVNPGNMPTTKWRKGIRSSAGFRIGLWILIAATMLMLGWSGVLAWLR